MQGKVKLYYLWGNDRHPKTFLEHNRTGAENLAMLTRNRSLRLLVSLVLLFFVSSCQAEKQKPSVPDQGQTNSNPISRTVDCNYTSFQQTVANFLKASAVLGNKPKHLLNSRKDLYFQDINRCLAVVEQKAFHDPQNWCSAALEYYQIASNVDPRLGTAENGAGINFYCIHQGQGVQDTQ